MKSFAFLFLISSSLAFPWPEYDSTIWLNRNETSVADCACDVLGTKNGTSSICDPETKQCDCNCAIEGISCNTCIDKHFNFPECEENPCSCDPNGSTSLICDKSNGQCPCKVNVGGRQCDTCEDGFKEHPDCISCECNPEGSNGESCSNSGQCECKDNVEGLPCDHCKDDHFGFPDCKSCECHEEGSDGLDCNLHGKCACKEHVTGDKCDQCQEGYQTHPLCDQCDSTHYGYPDCQACTCNGEGSEGRECNQETGECKCKANIEGKDCDSCKEGTFGFPDCKECSEFCNPDGSDGCDENGSCQCNDNVEGTNCDHCVDGFHGFPDCQPCECHEEGSDGLDCNENGKCTCKENVSGDKCDECKEHYTNFPACDQCDTNNFGYPDCKPCACSDQGSKSIGCDQETGDCECHENVAGQNCDSCNDGFFGFPECQECGCSCRGSLEEGKTCTPQGKCICKPGYAGDKCEKCTEGFYLEGEGLLENCIDCGCHPDGTTDGNQGCDALGQCSCNGVVTGKKCDQCKPGFYDFPDCKDCECDRDGAVNSVCNDQGICKCKEGIEGDRCSRCKPGFSGFPNCLPETDHCPEGWTREGVACFSATPEKLSFDNAVNRCDQLEGILAEPKTPLQNEYLVNFIKSQPYLKYSSGFWIGISDQLQENQFVYKSSNLDLIFTKYNDRQPDNWNQNEDCIELRTDWDDNWNDAPCYILKNFVCEKPANLCPFGWTLIGDQCLMTPNDKANHKEAVTYCRQHGGQLVAPQNWEENNLVVHFLKGQNHKKNENRFWLGITDLVTEDKFVLVDKAGEEAVFIPWASKPWLQPDNFGNEDCLELRLDMNNHWNDDNCNLIQSFVCQRPAIKN